MEWSLHIDTVMKILLALLFGGAIGLERELHGRSAGLRTHMLVCLGALLVIVVGRYTASVTNSDPGRVVAGVITGVGFLGAGVIIRMEQGVRGLTTAASLWLVAAIGVVVGFELYSVAAASTFMVLIILVIFSKLERILPDMKRRRIFVSFAGKPFEASAIESSISDCDCLIMNKTIRYNTENKRTTFEYVVKTKEKIDPIEIIDKISSFDNVKEVSWK